MYTRYKSNKIWELILFYFQIFYLTCTIWVSKTGQYFGLYCIGSCTNLGAYSYSLWRTTSAHRVAALFLDHFMSLQKIMISPTIRFIYFFTYFFSRNFISRFVFTCFILSTYFKKNNTRNHPKTVRIWSSSLRMTRHFLMFEPIQHRANHATEKSKGPSLKLSFL